MDTGAKQCMVETYRSSSREGTVIARLEFCASNDLRWVGCAGNLLFTLAWHELFLLELDLGANIVSQHLPSQQGGFKFEVLLDLAVQRFVCGKTAVSKPAGIHRNPYKRSFSYLCL